eukprot:gene15770-21893_t
MLKLLRSGPCWSHALSTSSTHPRLLQFSQPHGADDSSFKRNGRGVGWRSPLCDPIRLRAASVSFGTCSEEEEGEEEEEDEEIRRAESVAERLARVKNEEDEQLTRELSSLNVAIIVNVIILFSKLAVFLVSGSSAMLSEALHSAADTLNQFLLRVGVLKSLQAPTVIHPYGYTPASAAARKMPLWDYLKSGTDPTTVAVLLEDGGAILGLIIAAASTALCQWTGSAMWDAVGSMLVGLLLGAIATFLVAKNRQLLIGRSMAPADDVMAILRRDPVVSYVKGTMTEEIGPRIYRFKAEVAWNGAKGSEPADLPPLQALLTCMDLKGPEPADLPPLQLLLDCLYSKGYGPAELPPLQPDLSDLPKHPHCSCVRYMARAAGHREKNVDDIISVLVECAKRRQEDRIENEIQTMNPGIRYVDLETDRGKRALRPRLKTSRTMNPGIRYVDREPNRGKRDLRPRLKTSRTMNPGIRYVDLETDRGKRVLRPRRKTSRGGSLPDSSSGTPSYCNTTNPTAADAAAASATSTSYGTHGSEDRSASSSLPWHSGSSEHTSGDSQGMGSAEQIAGKGQGMDSNYLFGSLSSLSSLDECEKLGDLPDVYSFTNGSVANGEGPSTKFSSPEAPSAPTKGSKLAAHWWEL